MVGGRRRGRRVGGRNVKMKIVEASANSHFTGWFAGSLSLYHSEYLSRVDYSFNNLFRDNHPTRRTMEGYIVYKIKKI